MKTLARLLTPGGFLFVGPAETFLASNSGFTSMNQSMSFAFRRASSPTVYSGLSLPTPRKAIKKQPSPPPQQMASTSFASDPAPAPSVPPVSGLEAARCLADCGRLEEAAAWCEANLLKHGPSSETYYLLGLVRDAAGDRKGAAACYRKVVYLEPEHLEGLMHMALVSETEGDTAVASRLRERARRVERRANERVS